MIYELSTHRLIIFFHRGFGFVTFSDSSSVDKVLMNGPHELDGKKVLARQVLPVKRPVAY